MLSMPASAALVDIADEAYGGEIALLYDLGLVEGKEADLFMPADNLTRAEMTTIILRLLGAEGTTPAGFADVPEDHWASKIIGTAEQMKIVNGISETEFAPEAAVTYPQAVKMLVCALGYDVHAEAMGGYPSGYLSKASQIGVLDGTKDNGEAISRAMMAKLVANALEVNILVRTGYGDAYTYEEKENATLLNTYLGIEVIEGKVTANDTPTEALVTDAGNAVYVGGAVKMQLVRFKVNASDELLALETALDIKENRDSYSTEERTARFTEEKFYTSNTFYGAPMRMFGFRFMVREKTVVFRVPESYTGDDSVFAIMDPMSIGHQAAFQNLTLYDIDEDSVISAMVTVDGSGTAKSIGAIKSIAKTLGSDGESLNSVKLLTNAGEVAVTISDSADISL